MLSNGKIEIVIVPAIGRVMQMRFVGEEDGPFWELPELYGKAPDPEAKNWLNFGGDKTWPAPQSEWPRITPRSWPPPQAFDAMPVEAIVKEGSQGSEVELRSPVDPHYGIRTRRLIQLAAQRPELTISTTYEKLAGQPMNVSVWVITQLKDPQGVFLLLPKATQFADGYNKQSKQLPANLQRTGQLLSLTRDPKNSTKIGTDASTMLWVGEKHVLRIDAPRVDKREYPDQGSSAEVYTNPDPLTYVELETLGPLQMLSVGQQMTHTNRYTLGRRSKATPAVEARRWLK